MRYIKIAFMILISYVLQVTVLSQIKPFGVVPNLVTVFLVCYSLSETDWFRAGIIGAVCGLLLDISGGAAIGLCAVVCMYTAIFCSLLSRRFFRGKFLVSILFVLGVSLIYETVIYVFGFALWNSSNILHSITRVILPTTLCNTVAAAILFVPVRRINNVSN